MNTPRAPFLVNPSTRSGALWKAVPLMWRKRLAVLFAAITVPAMAAPGLTSLPGPAVESTAALATRQAAEAALPFERPGMSFPGSAFYYMADPAGSALVALPTDDPLGQGAAESGRELGALIDVGAAAKPFFSPGTGIAHARAQECLAQAVWYEAASESEAGQRAVAQVVLNRVAHPGWPASVCGVVYQGSERNTGCQFTFTCDGSLARRPGGASWARAQRIASEALSGKVYAPVGLATHYHTLWVNPYWAGTLDHIGTIGAHRFYRNRGAGGQAGAFSAGYAGLEPAVSGRTAPPPTVAEPEPSRPVIAYDFAPVPARKQGAAASSGTSAVPAQPAPAAPTETYSGTGAVKPEFARAGQWKAQPGAAPSPAAPAAPSPAKD
ncbi:cell wall hydrolase [Porphyrobacter sp. HT-58-2]|uniref:cell wall hydrolase n=1 Tax=Porphyrobacter sp. HT-58-2 TaxID=2023229 RepID=UPI001F2F5787|nr:cell wall hydrolase [Porphyrobacter sp. HT-58-2]